MNMVGLKNVQFFQFRFCYQNKTKAVQLFSYVNNTIRIGYTVLIDLALIDLLLEPIKAVGKRNYNNQHFDCENEYRQLLLYFGPFYSLQSK